MLDSAGGEGTWADGRMNGSCGHEGSSLPDWAGLQRFKAPPHHLRCAKRT